MPLCHFVGEPQLYRVRCACENGKIRSWRRLPLRSSVLFRPSPLASHTTPPRLAPTPSPTPLPFPVLPSPRSPYDTVCAASPITAVDRRNPRRRRHIAPSPSTSFRNQHTSHQHRGDDLSFSITTVICPLSSPWSASLQLPVLLGSFQSQTQLCGHSPCIS